MRRAAGRSAEQILDDGDVAVIDVGIGDHMHQLAGLESCDLGHHVHQHSILHHVPVVGGQHVLAALVQNGVERIAADIECHGIGARIQRHLVQIFKIV